MLRTLRPPRPLNYTRGPMCEQAPDGLWSPGSAEGRVEAEALLTRTCFSTRLKYSSGVVRSLVAEVKSREGGKGAQCHGTLFFPGHWIEDYCVGRTTSVRCGGQGGKTLLPPMPPTSPTTPLAHRGSWNPRRVYV